MAKTQNTSSIEYDEISIRDLLLQGIKGARYLYSKKKFILTCACIAGIAGGIYAYKSRPQYTAEVTFVIEGESSNRLGGYANIIGQLGLNMGGSAGGVFAGQNLITLIQSRSVIESALLTVIEEGGETKTLAQVFIEMNHLETDDPKFEGIKFPPGANRSQFTLEQNRALAAIYAAVLEDYLVLGLKDKNPTVNSLKVKSENELFSFSFSKALITVVSDFYIKTKTKKANDNLNILQRQTDSVKREYNSAVNGVAVSSEANPNPNPALQRLRVPSQRKQVDVAINQAILSELVKNLEVAKVSLRNETPLIQIIDKPILPLSMNKKSTGLFSILGFLFMGIFTSIIILIRKYLLRLQAHEE